jgi:hypothetical protein
MAYRSYPSAACGRFFRKSTWPYQETGPGAGLVSVTTDTGEYLRAASANALFSKSSV